MNKETGFCPGSRLFGRSAAIELTAPRELEQRQVEARFGAIGSRSP
jgi:hypothetical protein